MSTRATVADIDEMVRRYEGGASTSQVAAAMGRAEAGVRAHLKRRGVAMRPRGRARIGRASRREEIALLRAALIAMLDETVDARQALMQSKAALAATAPYAERAK